jgi:cell division protein ZipA
MSELRWILIALGVLLIGGLYVWGRRPFPKFASPLPKSPPAGAPSPEVPEAQTESSPEEPVVEKPRRRGPEKIVTLRVVCRHQDEMKAPDAVLALKRFGLQHGRYDIFHQLPDDGGTEPLFSVASLTEPGTFDLDNLEGSDIAGLSLFLVYPGTGDPVRRFDSMVALARNLAEDLDGVILDERGSSWSIQRERYIREEIIQFHHQLSRN